MFYLKNDDMEKLFRKAAENYELDTGRASDWESISRKLSVINNNAAGEDEKKKKKRKFIFWWFLLFPAGWMAHNTWDKIGKHVLQKAPVMQQQHIQPVTPPLVSPYQPANDIIRPNDNTVPPVQTTEQANDLPERETGQIAATGKAVVITGNAVAVKNNSAREKVKNTDPGKTPGIFPSLAAAAPLQALTAVLQMVDERGYALPELSGIKHIPVEMSAHSPGIAKSADSPAGKAAGPVTPSPDRYMYAQVVAAPDLTTVKFQRISGAGSSIGLLLGYRFNKRLHVEAAGYWEKKVYYTKGVYFDKSGLPYLNNHEIYNVDGDCNMITIPVNLRYNFISKKNSDWFVTGGMAAYLMQKEYYDITYDYYGSARTKGYAYKNAPESWLATVNVGAGYQSTIWRSLNVRVEPYIRIPVSGAGTGKLPLTSAGIYIGIGRRF
ncbi:MAG: hypothetical protein KF862_25035 [Chitinophagaceae bacterium]|nr:hypothetical protein [Chitinophagaceae bacterium]